MTSLSVKQRLPILVAAIVAAAVAPEVASAQQVGAVLGTVTDANTGEVLVGVQVHFPELESGTITDAQGRFVIRNIPVGRHEIRAALIGRRATTQFIEVVAGENVVVNLSLETSAIGLDAVVVTGVAAATPVAQLPFTVDQLDVSVQSVPAATAGGLIQGRIAGATVVQGSGLPGAPPSIQLRGPTSITGSQEPLIIVDGVISRGSLADINPLDIANIEVVKGAAAASLYGSRAQAGVIQITTKRGASLGDGGTRITLRNSFQMNSIENYMRLTESHPYRLNEAGTEFLDVNGDPVELPAEESEFALDDGGSGTNPYTAFADNPFPPPTSDPMRQFFDPGNSYRSYISMAANEGDTQYRFSGGYSREQGVVQFHNGFEQLNGRLNLDHRLTDDFQISLSTYIADMSQDLMRQGSSGILRDLTFMSAKTGDLLARDEDGELKIVGDPIDNQENPLYTLANEDWTRERQRIMGSVRASYSLFPWLTLEGNVSYDRSDVFESFFRKPGFKRTRNRPPLEGEMETSEERRSQMNASLTASINRAFGDFTTRSRLRWLVEDQSHSGFTAGGSNFPVSGVPRLGLITGALDIDSFERAIRSEGFFFITALTYQGKYVLDFLARRDGSSLFGSDERWQNYYRVSSAWRMSEESWWPFDFITEFKPRYSIGTSGGRPGFDYQYQTYGVDRGQIVPQVLGNSNLKPELATEQEFGIDAVIADRFRVQVNYVDLNVEDQLLLVPLPSYFGFESQWRNAGTLASTTWEGMLDAAIIERPNFLWTARLVLDRTRSKITELNVPPYEIRDYRARMLIKEGEVLGAFYGTKWANNCQLDLPAGVDCSQFEVNDDGLLVWVGEGNSYRDGMAKDLWGTRGTTGGESYRWGMPIPSKVGDGFTKLGESLPDLNISLNQNIQWRDFALTVLLDGEFGAQIYNQTRQWCTRSHCAHFDQAGKPDELKKPIAYYGAAGLYARNLRSSWFVEDADYVKLRELSLRYTLEQAALPSFLQNTGVESATISLIGRNLKTWTDYLGYDPEVGSSTFGGSAAIGRIDEYFYPNYRSFGVDLQLVF